MDNISNRSFYKVFFLGGGREGRGGRERGDMCRGKLWGGLEYEGGGGDKVREREREIVGKMRGGGVDNHLLAILLSV